MAPPHVTGQPRLPWPFPTGVPVLICNLKYNLILKSAPLNAQASVGMADALAEGNDISHVLSDELQREVEPYYYYY